MVAKAKPGKNIVTVPGIQSHRVPSWDGAKSGGHPVLLLSPASGQTTEIAKSSTAAACRIGDLLGGKYTDELNTLVCPGPMFPSTVAIPTMTAGP